MSVVPGPGPIPSLLSALYEKKYHGSPGCWDQDLQRYLVQSIVNTQYRYR